MPPEIDYEKCIGCGMCVNVCAEEVFFDPGEATGKGDEKKPEVTCAEACCHCSLCAQVCPEGAVSVGAPAPYK